MQANPNKPDMLPGRRHTLQPRLLLPHRPEVHSLSSHHEIAMQNPCVQGSTRPGVGKLDIHNWRTCMCTAWFCFDIVCPECSTKGTGSLRIFSPAAPNRLEQDFPTAKILQLCLIHFPTAQNTPSALSKSNLAQSSEWQTGAHLFTWFPNCSLLRKLLILVWTCGLFCMYSPPQKKECKNHHPPQILRYGGQPAMCGKKSCLMILIQSELVRTALCKQRLEFVTMSLCFIAMTTIGNSFDQIGDLLQGSTSLCASIFNIPCKESQSNTTHCDHWLNKTVAKSWNWWNIRKEEAKRKERTEKKHKQTATRANKTEMTNKLYKSRPTGQATTRNKFLTWNLKASKEIKILF